MLNAEERAKFVAWLEQESKTAKLLVEQLDKMGHCKSIAQMYKAEAAACLIIANKLQRTETQEL